VQSRGRAEQCRAEGEPLTTNPTYILDMIQLAPFLYLFIFLIRSLATAEPKIGHESFRLLANTSETGSTKSASKARIIKNAKRHHIQSTTHVGGYRPEIDTAADLIDISNAIRAQEQNLSTPPLFVNPLVSDYFEIFTERNRCILYPRCLLFGCCPSLLAEHMDVFFQNEAVNRPFACMFAGTCNYSVPFPERTKKLWTKLVGINVTAELVQEWLSKLPPTSPAAYRALRKRHQREEFKVLYMTQAKNKKDVGVNLWYLNDLLYMSWLQSPEEGSYPIQCI
jgi:hypothetical protein